MMIEVLGKSKIIQLINAEMKIRFDHVYKELNTLRARISVLEQQVKVLEVKP